MKMNMKYLLLQGLLLVSVVVNLFIPKNLFLKLLLIALLFLYGLLILQEFKYNRDRYLFSASSFVVIAILFLLVEYIHSDTYLIILVCLLVAFMYLSRTLFSKTFGEVLESNGKLVKVKITDELFSYGKKYQIRSAKPYKPGTLVLIGLDKTFLRKPVSIIKELSHVKEKAKSQEKVSKNTKKPRIVNNKAKK